MRKTALTLNLALALLFLSFAATQIVSFAETTSHNSILPRYYLHISIQSPEEKTYYDTDTVHLNFTLKSNVEQNASISYFYVLDGKDYRYSSVEVEEIYEYMLDGEYCYEGHVILSNLSVGPHIVEVWRGYSDSDGILQYIPYSSDPPTNKVHFSVEQEPFSTTIVVASVASVAIVSVGLLVYFKKRKL